MHKTLWNETYGLMNRYDQLWLSVNGKMLGAHPLMQSLLKGLTDKPGTMLSGMDTSSGMPFLEDITDTKEMTPEIMEWQMDRIAPKLEENLHQLSVDYGFSQTHSSQGVCFYTKEADSAITAVCFPMKRYDFFGSIIVTDKEFGKLIKFLPGDVAGKDLKVTYSAMNNILQALSGLGAAAGAYLLNPNVYPLLLLLPLLAAPLITRAGYKVTKEAILGTQYLSYAELPLRMSFGLRAYEATFPPYRPS